MKIKELAISDVKLLEPEIISDKRGYFYEVYNKSVFDKLMDKKINFVQDNQSLSKKGVIRGLHYQNKPYEQGKLVRVISGSIFDVAVDLRKNSSTYLKWVYEILSSENRKQLWIPEGFAHGFLSLEDNTTVIYKTTNFYSKEHERTLRYDDQAINILWPNSNHILSDKDSLANTI
jgi:dTDP-4-dehydrorhamnose 3,5-epimerase